MNAYKVVLLCDLIEDVDFRIEAHDGVMLLRSDQRLVHVKDQSFLHYR